MNRFYTMLALLVAVGIGLLLFLMIRSPSPTIPVQVAVTAADTAGFTGYVLGSETAPVTISEYADYQCPACQDFAVVQWPSVRRTLVESGLVRWRFRDFPLQQHPHARVAAHSPACASES